MIDINKYIEKAIHLLYGLLYCGDCEHKKSMQSRRKKIIDVKSNNKIFS